MCANVTRSIYFGKVPKDLERIQTKVNFVISKFYSSAIPKKSMKELFEIGKKAYDEAGYKENGKIIYRVEYQDTIPWNSKSMLLMIQR